MTEETYYSAQAIVPAVTLSECKKILLFLPYGIGDVVMNIRSLHALRANSPRAVIHCIGSQPAVQLLDDDKTVDSTEHYGTWRIQHLWDEGDCRTESQFLAWFKQNQFDGIVDLTLAPPVIQSALKGLASFEREGATYKQALRNGKSGYEAFYLANQIGWRISRPADQGNSHIAIHESREREAQDTLSRLGRRNSQTDQFKADEVPWAAICMSASLPMKRWPLERFAKLADWLIEQYSCRILLSAGPSEEWASEIIHGMVHKGSGSVIPPLHLLTVASLFKHCFLLVGNDTGMMHLASAVGTPVLAIFGPTDPEVFLPRTKHARSIGGIGILCERHGRHYGGVPQCWGESRCPVRPESCINEVRLESVKEAAREMLQQLGWHADAEIAPGQRHAAFAIRP